MLIPEDLDMELDEFVERFEMASAGQPGIDVSQFLPDQQHPRYAEIACELLRVHMELSASAGRFISAEDYRHAYPQVCGLPENFKALQAEEARVKASSRAMALMHSSSPPTHEPVPNTLGRPERVEMPRSGQNVCGFQLIAELGRGAFSQVFLAQDGTLSQRRVVLKISSKLLGEADLLSRLQHKNIVPVYSLHRYGQYHLICMPFLGTMTLGDMMAAQPKSSSALSGKELISTLAAQASLTWKESESTTANINPNSGSTGDTASSNNTGSTTATANVNANVTTAGASEGSSRDTLSDEGSESRTHNRGLSSQLATEVSRMSTTELALWIVSELADGLAHAHQRGVLHRDIKPANVLLSDDGLPMLLDFNLATSTRSSDSSHQVVGGTLRYMSPEQLQSVQSGRSTSDARADVFSLSVVLYELLFRSVPFVDRTGSWADVLEQMLNDRRTMPALKVDWREGLTPGVLSIISRGLAFEPNQRYQSASEFRDDLRAHLQFRALPTASDRSIRERVRKWNARHPRLSSMTLAVATIGVVLCCTIAWNLNRQSQLNRLAATNWAHKLQHMQSDARTLLASDAAPSSAIENWLHHSASVLTPDTALQLNRLPPSDASQARRSLGRLHFYRARGAIGLLQRQQPSERTQWIDVALVELELAQSYEPFELATAWQDSLRALAEKTAAAQTLAQPETNLVSAPTTGQNKPSFQLDHEILKSELNVALADTHIEASNPWYWLGIGQMQLVLGELEPAAASFMVGHNLSQRHSLPTFFLGLVEMKRKNFRQAEDWFTFTLAQDPQCWEAWLNRAAARVELSKFALAIEDLASMGEQADRYPRAWFIRELAETRLGKSTNAEQCRQRGLKLVPTDALGWNARGQAKLRQKPIDAQAALADFDNAISVDPQLRNAYENAAHVLSERLNQPQAAIDRLTEVLRIDPSYALAWSSRAVLFARQKQFDAALQDVEQALQLERSPMICYQCASALALRDSALRDSTASDATNNADTAKPATQSDASREPNAMQLLKETLRKDPSLSRFMRKDQDLGDLLHNQQFQELMNAAARLQ